MLRYKYLQFLEKLTELKPEKKYHTKDRMDKIAFSSVQKKIETRCNQGKLLDLVMNGKTDIPEYKYLYFGSAEKIRSRALQMITNQEDLFLIATNKKGETALAAISRISDPDLLVRIALAPEKNAYDKVREALSRLHDMDKLQYIAERSTDSLIVQYAKRRLREENSILLCNNSHDWIYLRTETDDDGDSPRYDYEYEKCARCGVIRCTTRIAGRIHSTELDYDAKE